MNNENENNFEENELVGFELDDEDADELLDSKFVNAEVISKKFEKTKDEKTLKFLDENNNILGEKIIETKTGAIIEIKYNENGLKESYIKRDKQKRIRRAVDYYENGVAQLATDYEPDGSYKSYMYEVDGTLRSFVDKHADGTSDSIYYNIDKNGSKLLIKMDADKQVIEKKVERG